MRKKDPVVIAAEIDVRGALATERQRELFDALLREAFAAGELVGIRTAGAAILGGRTSTPAPRERSLLDRIFG